MERRAEAGYFRDEEDDRIATPEPYEPSTKAIEIVGRIIETWRARDWFFDMTESMPKTMYEEFREEAWKEVDDCMEEN
jgi:hypothetical protein